jgi:predicted P-loop ATPase
MILVKQTQKFERLQDHHITEARIWFDSNFWEPITSQNMREILHACAMRAQSNVARDWLESQQWDGTDRMPEFLKRLRVKQDPYTLSVARYMWTAMAGRVYEPGCQADSIIVLLGPQGVGKTRAFNAIAPVICGERTVREITINMLLSDDSSARAMRGTIIANMDEMRYVTKKEASDVKAALSRSHESYIPKYMESRMSFGRTGIICGTGNEFEILDDSTGSRRYYILEVKDTIDVDWIAINSPQLWAQGLTDYKSNGVAWQEAQNLAPDATAENRIEDPWEDAIHGYVSKHNADRLTTPDILLNAVGLATDKMDQRAKKRVASVMATLGWRQMVTKIPGTRKNHRVWELTSDDGYDW